MSRWVWIFLLTVCLATVLSGAALWLRRSSVLPRNTPFASDQWLKGDARVRGSMVDDLSKSGRLIGKSRAEVKAVLGPPETELPERWAYKVDIGHRMVSSPWYYYLELGFDTEGKVLSVELKD